MLLSILVFILVLGVLVFIHELGHFMVAKWTGMQVDEFAIGFPPRLWSWQRGETRYSLNLLPLGGYVRIHGEQAKADEEPNPRSFNARPVWARMLVVLAGVFMNFFFALFVLTIAFSIGFVSTSQDLTQVPGATRLSTQVFVGEVFPNSPADHAGLQPGDYLLSLSDGNVRQDVGDIPGLQQFVKDHQQSGNLALQLRLQRDGLEQVKNLTLNPSGPGMGVALDPLDTVRVPFWRAPGVAWHEVGFISTTTWDGLKGFGSQLVRAHLDPSVSGPIGIYHATASAARQGIIPTIFLMVALSVNLGLLNILPIPVLDGGRFLFLVVEAVFRRRVITKQVEGILTTASFGLLLLLIAVVTLRDIVRMF